MSPGKKPCGLIIHIIGIMPHAVRASEGLPGVVPAGPPCLVILVREISSIGNVLLFLLLYVEST